MGGILEALPYCFVKKKCVRVRNRELTARLEAHGPCLTLVAVFPMVALGTLFPALSSDMVTRRFWRAATLLLAAIPIVARVTTCQQSQPRRKDVALLECPWERRRPHRAVAGERVMLHQCFLATHSSRSACPGSRVCSGRSRPACRSPACSAARSGIPQSTQGQTSTLGKLDAEGKRWSVTREAKQHRARDRPFPPCAGLPRDGI